MRPWDLRVLYENHFQNNHAVEAVPVMNTHLRMYNALDRLDSMLHDSGICRRHLLTIINRVDAFHRHKFTHIVNKNTCIEQKEQFHFLQTQPTIQRHMKTFISSRPSNHLLRQAGRPASKRSHPSTSSQVFHQAISSQSSHECMPIEKTNPHSSVYPLRTDSRGHKVK